MRFLFLFFLILTVMPFIHAQDAGNKRNVEIRFIAHPEQKFGFDQPGIGKPDAFYDKLKIGSNRTVLVPNKSIGFREADYVRVVCRNLKKAYLTGLQFSINDSLEVLTFTILNDTLLDLRLPPRAKGYSIAAKYKDQSLGRLNVQVFKPVTETIRIVQMTEGKIDTEYLEEFLNEIYRQVNIRIKVADVSVYTDTILNKEGLLKNPSALNDRYTDQMRSIRDRYFESNPKAPKKSYYLFIVPGFVNDKVDGYMTRDHAIAFIKNQNEPDMFHTIARELGHGIGMLNHFWIDSKIEEGGTLNLMDRNGGTELMRFQWKQLRHPSRSYNFYDPDEDLRTNNGLVAYYFWKEDRNGFIRFDHGTPISAIYRPYKKNYLSYHQNLSDSLFKVILDWNGYIICVWHLVIIGAMILAWIIVKVVLWFRRRRSVVKYGFFHRKLKDWTINMVIISMGIGAFLSVGFFFKRHEITSGLIADMDGRSMEMVISEILNNRNLSYEPVKGMRTEILLNRKGRWYMKRRKNVLYFDVYKNEQGNYDRCILRSDANKLIVTGKKFEQEAQSHYSVYSFRNEKDSIVQERVFNHLGIDITNKLFVKDAAKRILIFINGYRPTSIGHTPEENFRDIKANGVEYPNSTNLLYEVDKHSYWNKWEKMDNRFKNRINPSEVYYADGHFSVATSNHRSLLNFTQLITQYPKRCWNPKKHTCYKTKVLSTGILGDKVKSTYSLLPNSPNRRGFRERKENGRIAGKNLLMMLNEIPNRSENDTIYMVAHSMGYAYALGMIEELRGQVHFGGFYIIAPENASSGKVRTNEWQEVWQYGSRLNKDRKDPPCLQDGVAPQSRAGGLSESSRAYFPRNWYWKQGFFDSHYIGHYTWIFDIPKGQPGYIEQR